jgi:hypothetical protein
MSRKRIDPLDPLQGEEAEAFQKGACALLQAFERLCKEHRGRGPVQDSNAYQNLLARLYYILIPEDFEQFAEIIRDALDQDTRCPQ